MYRSKHHVTKSRVAEAEDRQVPFTFHDPKPCTKKNKGKNPFHYFLVHPDFFNYDLSIFQKRAIKKLIENCSMATQVSR